MDLLEDYSAPKIESKWQRKWSEEGIFQAEPALKKKFFITIPYPYLNGTSTRATREPSPSAT